MCCRDCLTGCLSTVVETGIYKCFNLYSTFKSVKHCLFFEIILALGVILFSEHLGVCIMEHMEMILLNECLFKVI